MSAKPNKISDLDGDGLRPKCRDEKHSHVQKHETGRNMTISDKMDEAVQAVILFQHLPDEAIVRLPTVLALFPVSDGQVWRMVRDGSFPSPVKLADRAIGWKAGAIREFLRKDRPVAEVGSNPVGRGRKEGVDHAH